MTKPQVRGKVEMKPLKAVKPNSWNPNAMTDFEKASLKSGLQNDGWLISQALLIWGTDENGKRKDLIIDGEHRWYAASELGFEKGPMVYLDNLPEAEAKALTIKMDAKRGKFKQDRLAELLKEIQFDLPEADLALGVGIPEDEMMRMLNFEPEIIQPVDEPEARMPVVPAPTEQAQMQQGHVKLVQLFFGEADFNAFNEAAKAIAEKSKTKNISETVLAAMKLAGG